MFLNFTWLGPIISGVISLFFGYVIYRMMKSSQIQIVSIEERLRICEQDRKEQREAIDRIMNILQRWETKL